MNIYLAGAMTGQPEGGFPVFREAATALREQGHDVTSPAELNEHDGMLVAATPDHPRRGEFLARDIAIVINPTVEAVAILPGWEASEGAQVEVAVAHAIGKPVLVYPGLDPVPGRHPASARFHAILRSWAALYDRKQSDYGRGEDPFANVRGSAEWGIEAWIGAMIRATDKIRRLQTFARKGTLANEGVIDSFDDLGVYAAIARVLFEESLD